MTICPIALAVGCEKCPAFKFCPLTYVLGDQQEFDDEIESTNKDWVKRTYPTKADEHLDKMDDLEEKMRLTKDERFARIKESAEEELEKNTKQMESFKGEDAEVIPEKKKLTKDERLALIKESAKKKSVGKIDWLLEEEE